MERCWSKVWGSLNQKSVLGFGNVCQILEEEKLDGCIQGRRTLKEINVWLEFLIKHFYKNGA